MRHGPHHRGGLLGSDALVVELLSHLFGVAHGLDLGLREVASHQRERFRHDTGRQPAFFERLSEGAFFLDHAVDGNAMLFGNIHQQILEDLTTHTCVLHRVPVHETDGA